MNYKTEAEKVSQGRTFAMQGNTFGLTRRTAATMLMKLQER